MLNSSAKIIPEGEASAQTEHISVTAEDIYCDGRNLICTFRAETDMTEAMVLNTDLTVTINGQEYTMPTLDNTGYLKIDMMMLADQTDSGVYYGTLNFRIPDELTGTPEISVTCNGFHCYKNVTFTAENNLGTITDEVVIDIPVTLKKDVLYVTEVNYEGTALKVQSVESSPAGIAVTYDNEMLSGVVCIYDENGNKIARKENGCLHSGNLYDENGNIVERNAEGWVYDSDWLTEFFEASDTDYITIRLVDKNTDPLVTLDEVTVSLH